jgi:CBS domain-containing protein
MAAPADSPSIGPMTNPASTPHTAITLATATVADAMTVGVINCAPDTPLSEVARMMARYRVHSVFVHAYEDDRDGPVEVWGLVSDLDVVAGAWAGVEERTAGESSVTPLVTVRSDDRLEHSAQLMAEHGVSHLAVIDDATGRPVGVISSLDIARVFADVPRDERAAYGLSSLEHVLR